MISCLFGYNYMAHSLMLGWFPISRPPLVSQLKPRLNVERLLVYHESATSLCSYAMDDLPLCRKAAADWWFALTMKRALIASLGHSQIHKFRDFYSPYSRSDKLATVTDWPAANTAESWEATDSQNEFPTTIFPSFPPISLTYRRHINIPVRKPLEWHSVWLAGCNWHFLPLPHDRNSRHSLKLFLLKRQHVKWQTNNLTVAWELMQPLKKALFMAS